MPMPTKNIMFNELTPKTPVELRGETNQYWVATIDGQEGVVIMDGQHQRDQQRTLTQMTHDTKMRNKGYKYRLTPTTKRFEPLYAKTLAQVGPLMREYPNDRFETVEIG